MHDLLVHAHEPHRSGPWLVALAFGTSGRMLLAMA
jgi:hypothetical protein